MRFGYGKSTISSGYYFAVMVDNPYTELLAVRLGMTTSSVLVKVCRRYRLCVTLYISSGMRKYFGLPFVKFQVLDLDACRR
mgnify:CR=1 FL=1